MLEIRPVIGTTIETLSFQKKIGENDVLMHQATPAGVTQAIRHLRERSGQFRKMRTGEILGILDKARALWKKGGAYRCRYLSAMLASTGRSGPTLENEIDVSVNFLDGSFMKELVARELGSAEVLDEWVDNGYVRHRRHPLGLVFHNLAGNAMAVTTASIFFGLVTRNVNLVKSPSEDPFFPALFAESLGEIDDRILDGLAVIHWPGSAGEYYERVFAAQPEGVVHWGGKDTLKAISAFIGCTGTRFIEHGPKVSFAAVDAYEKGIGEKIARDAALWEQRACLSPRVVFALEGFAEALAEDIASGFEKVSAELPAQVTPDLGSRLLAKRQGYLLDVEAAGYGKVLYCKDSLSSVVYKKTPVTEDDVDACMDRFIIVKPVKSMNEVLDFLGAPGLKPYLQTLGYSGSDDAFKNKASLLGVSHITRIGQMTVHMPGYSHDGFNNLVQFTTLASDQKDIADLHPA